MHLTICIEGLNLEKLLTEAAEAGIVLRDVRRLGERRVHARAAYQQMKAIRGLCGRMGWEMHELHADATLRVYRFAKSRRMLFAGLALGAALVYLSSQMILAVEIAGAQQSSAEIRRLLLEEGIRPGRMKASFSTDALSGKLALRLPGLKFAACRYEGSTLLVDCQTVQEGEQTDIAGDGMDIIAACDGIVTRVSVSSGTPQIKPGDVVRKGQVLILGQERTEKGETRAIRAQGQVMARVWARGAAQVSLYETKTVETGAVSRRVTLHSPWHMRVVRDAEPFASSDTSRERQSVVGLYLPVWREIETIAETIVTRIPRSRSDAASMAQGAAEEIAKKQCPFHALILDKTVDYSMIDNEYLYAEVVLAYETAIADRLE